MFKWAMNDPEQLVYDLNMGIGDSLPGYGPNEQATRYVTAVGMTQLLDGLPRKTIILDNVCGPTQWVEGVGETTYFLDSETVCSLWDGVLLDVRCIRTDGQLVYLRPGLSGCYTIGTDEQLLGALSIYPNPVAEQVTLSVEQSERISDISVFDQLGRLTLAAQGTGGHEARLQVGDLPVGMYLAKARAVSGKLFLGKFWKN